MIKEEVFKEIKRLKKNHLNKLQVARRTGCSYRTIQKYWELTPAEFKKLGLKKHNGGRPSQCKKYHDEILSYIIEFPELSAAAIYNRLLEMHPGLEVKEGTVRRYVRILRKDLGIPKEIY